MKQSSFRYLGLVDLLLVAVVVAAFGAPAVTASPILPAMAVAGALAVLAGSVASLSVGPVAAGWRQAAGASYALFALGFPAQFAAVALSGHASSTTVAIFGAASVGSLSILFLGVDVARDGPHFRVTPNVDRAFRI